MLEMRYDPKDPDNLRITIKSPKRAPRHMKMRLLHLDEDDVAEMPEHHYGTILTMASEELQMIVRDNISNGETLRIRCKQRPCGGHAVTFSSTGDAGEMENPVDLDQEGTELEQFDDIDMEVRRLAVLLPPLFIMRPWKWTSSWTCSRPTLHGWHPSQEFGRWSTLCSRTLSTWGRGISLCVMQRALIFW